MAFLSFSARMKEMNKNTAFYTFFATSKIHTVMLLKKRETESSDKHKKVVEYAIATQVSTSKTYNGEANQNLNLWYQTLTGYRYSFNSNFF